MKKREFRSHWGEFAGLQNAKREVTNCFDILPMEKKTKLENLNELDDRPTERSLKLENPVVTQTIEAMHHRDRLVSSMENFRQNSITYNELVPKSSVPAETMTFLPKVERVINPAIYMTGDPTAFGLGKQKPFPQINRSIALEAICKSVGGLLRLKGFHDCTESSLLMLVDGVDEFYKCFMERINEVKFTEDRERETKLDVLTLEKAYTKLTGSSLTNLHNYYKNEVIHRNRSEIQKLKCTVEEYDKFLEDNESKFEIKEEFTGYPKSIPSNSTEGNAITLSDSESSSYKESNYDRNQSSVDDSSRMSV